jgi:hypothetical protein
LEEPKAARLIQTRDDLELFQPLIAQCQERFCHEAPFSIKHIHPELRGDYIHGRLSSFDQLFEIDFSRFDST